MLTNLTAVSLFSGCGGFDLGAQRAGVRVVWANDIDPVASAAYRRLLPDVPFEEGDIRDVEGFPEADILIGCYPCTGFSQAAKRRGKRLEKRDLRANLDNYLYEEFLRVLKAVRPKFLFVENVKGMLSAAGGWFFQQQQEGFEEAGYAMSHKLLDASEYGVAQQRKRVFLVGVSRDLYDAGFRYTFPAPTHGPGRAHPYITLHDAIHRMKRWPEGEFCTKTFHGHYLTRNRKKAWSDRGYTVVAHAHHVPLHPMGDSMVKLGKDQWALQGDENRRLSWPECAELQGLPRTVGEGEELISAYRIIGNAVPPPVARALIGSLQTAV